MQSRKFERCDEGYVIGQDPTKASSRNNNLMYVNTSSNSKIKKLTISCQPPTYVIINLDFCHENQASMQDTKLRLIESIPELLRGKYISESDIIFFPFLVIRCDFKAREDLYALFTAIDLCEQLDYQTSIEISSFLAIPTFLNDSELIVLLENNSYEEAFSKAVLRQKNDPHVLYRLAKLCQTYCEAHPQRLVDCYQAIAKDSPYYEEANDELLHIAIHNNPESTVTEEERISNLEKLFYFAINSGDKNAQLASQFYHQLCGYTDMNPTLHDIKGDYDTLIKLATKIRELKQANDKLLAEKRSAENGLVHSIDTQSFFNRNNNNSSYVSHTEVKSTMKR